MQTGHEDHNEYHNEDDSQTLNRWRACGSVMLWRRCRGGHIGSMPVIDASSIAQVRREREEGEEDDIKEQDRNAREG